LSKTRYLLDVNVLIALAEVDHLHHKSAMRWLDTPGLDWGVCAFTEAGFLRVSTNARVGAHSVKDATAVLEGFARHPGYRFWPINKSWTELATPLLRRVFGHQQIVDSYLLGLAIKENGVLVTMDKAIEHMAGDKHKKNILVLE
jgi:hypothetical protein